jgi:hypothetical protein
MIDTAQVRKTRLDAFLGLLQIFVIERDFWVTAGFVAPLPISAGSSLLELLFAVRTRRDPYSEHFAGICF